MGGIGLIAGTINDDMYKILFMGKAYHVHKQFVKSISMKRKDSVNEDKLN